MSSLRVAAVVTSLALLVLVPGVILLADDSTPTDIVGQKFLAYLSTDKPIYRAGDRVFIRAVVLDADSHKPLPMSMKAYSQLRITGPRGEQVAGGTATIQDGVLGYAWDVPGEAAGGQYKIVAQFPSAGLPPAERKFEVRAYRVPRLKGEIIFLRDGFGAGDTVKAALHVERAEGGLPAGAGVAATAVVDGANVFQGSTTVDAGGNCSLQFKLPDRIEVGDGTLSLAISDGGVVEPIAKTIPILVNSVDVNFFPEGGDLVAYLPNRVYVESRTPSKKPADIKGQIFDSLGNAVADVKTDHEGRGRFTFTPRDGAIYSLKLSEPAGISKQFTLPEVKPSGVVLTAGSDITGKDQPVNLQCGSTAGGSYTVSLSKHGMNFSSQMFDLPPGKVMSFALGAPGWADGVLTATVRDHAGKAVAERLVFRQPDHVLNVKVTGDKESYVPGGGVSLTVTTTDDQGKPVGANVGITVTDDSVLKMLEKRDRAPRLNEMVFLENDVRELADAETYFDPTNSSGYGDIDLLLGTQGWRRFAGDNEQYFLSKFGNAARRAMANRQPQMLRTMGDSGGRAFGGGGGGLGGGGFAPMAARSVKDFNDAAAEIDTVTFALPGEILDDGKDMPRVLPAFGGVFGGRGMAMAKMMPAPPRNDGTEVRIYAHDLRPDYQPGHRQDFTETVYWTSYLTTSPADGTATVNFKLNDSVTSFKVAADAFDAAGELGEGAAAIHSVEPFYVEPKLPLEVSTGDVIRLPIAAVNGTGDQLPVRLTLSGGSALTFGDIPEFPLPPGARTRRITQINVGGTPGNVSLRLNAQAGQFSDDVTRQLAIKSVGFPTSISHGGTLDSKTHVVQTVEIPNSLVAGSLSTHLALYATPLGNLTDTLKRLIQEPCGCFEQTSSTAYPLVMADQYFLTHSGVDPQVIAQSNALLQTGYEKLVSFECKTKGYEWFGEDPGHECLSAYAVLEFTDMSAVRTVDQAMLQDTRKWLLNQRDGKGGFTHERRALHTWIADPDCSNGYCTWALLEAGERNLAPEVAWLKHAAQTDPNSYVKALAANAMFLAGDQTAAREFMDALARRQESDGHVSGATISVVGSQGDSLEIETTALAALAWLREPSYAGNALKAMQFLASACEGGRYGSTQSTVLALRAIVEYDKAHAHPGAPGKVQLLVDGRAVGEGIPFNSATQGAIELPEFAPMLTAGKHEVELRMIDGAMMPYAMEINFNSATPASSEACKVQLAVSMKETQLAEGAATEADVTVTNRAAEPIPTPIAIIGLPGGLEVRYDQLKELVKAQRIAAYEVRGREVVLYWRDLQANQRVQVPLSLIAAVPGDYTGPASRAYEYYTDENKQWVDGMKVSIAAK